MFIVHGPDGHCRRHEDKLKLRSVPKPNRQRHLNRPAPIDSNQVLFYLVTHIISSMYISLKVM